MLITLILFMKYLVQEVNVAVKNKIDLTKIYKFHYEVGVIKDRYSSKPVNKTIKSFAGGKARIARGKSKTKISDVLKKAEKKDKVLTSPFKSKRADMTAQLARLFNPSLKLSTVRIKNILAGLVQRPILRGDYGGNTPSTIKNKGFNRKWVDTGTTVKNIDAIKVEN